MSDALPALIAILRGLPSAQAIDIAATLIDRGIDCLEVPLTSADSLRAIEAIAGRFANATIGAGTVVDLAQIAAVQAAGGRLIVSPHCDPALIRASLDAGMRCLPGVATPSEACAASRCGATELKVFPAEMVTPTVLRAWMTVLAGRARLYPVGGIRPEALAPYLAAGASGFGLGSALYRPGDDVPTVGRQADRFVQAWRDAASLPPSGGHGPLKAG